MLDFPATGAALWAGFDAGKLPRPEYVLPVLYTESGFNPAVKNAAGYPYRGINQASDAWLTAHGIDLDDYLTWPASRQISTVVAPMFASTIAAYGPLNSGTLAYVANFYPVAVKPARGNLSYVIATRGSAVYTANAVFDYTKKGTITVGDLAHFIATSASSSAVKSAIASTYALRPGATPMDPIYGTDFPVGSSAGARALLAAGAATGIALAIPRSRAVLVAGGRGLARALRGLL